MIADDVEPQIAEDALAALISAIHPSLEVPELINHLAEVLGSLGNADLRKVRKEVDGLRALFVRAEVSDGRPKALEEFAAHLPQESAEDRLWSLSQMNSWDKEDGELARHIEEAATAIGADRGPNALLELLAEGEPRAAFEIGRVLSKFASERSQYLAELRRYIDGPNSAAIVGYLWQATESGDLSAFDDFIDSTDTTALRKVELTVRGPITNVANERISRLVDELSVADGARLLFRWMRDASADQIADQADAWRIRMSTQIDYNATVDLLALWLHGREDAVNERLLDTIFLLLAERRRFPQLGQQSWDWRQLAARVLGRDPAALADLMLDLVDDDAIDVYEGSDEESVLKAAIENAGPSTWTTAMERVAGGSWRLVFATRGWLADCVDVAVVEEWVGDDLDRARAIASIATLGEEGLTDVAVFLLSRYSGDSQVSSSLHGEFVSGTWMGSEADRIGDQIDRIRAWLDQPTLAKEVKKWLRKLEVDLAVSQAHARQREAEQRF
jgi:hypothetical protein